MFHVDYSNLDAVIAYAKTLGRGMTVKKHADRANYNICHTSRKDLWDLPNVTIHYQS